jgi:hypothetical protein
LYYSMWISNIITHGESGTWRAGNVSVTSVIVPAALKFYRLQAIIL